MIPPRSDIPTTCSVSLFLAVSLLCVSLAPAGVPDDDPRVTPVVRGYRKAGPAVVNISSKRRMTVRMGLFGDEALSGLLPPEIGPRRNVSVESLGSGTLIHPSGYILTCAHVVRGAQDVRVTLADKRTFPARVVVAELASDLAILKIDPKKGKPLPFLRLGRSDDLMIGETLIAVGNPGGLGSSVSTGILSAIDRTLQFGDGIVFKGLLQTDAPINRGNSGGPLLNVKGEFVGINTAVSPDSQGIGFAIPIEQVRYRLGSLLDVETLRRVEFGASVRQRSPAAGGEVYVTYVRPGSPADKLLQADDRILAVDAVRVQDIADYVLAMLAVDKARNVTFRVLRDGKRLDVKVPLRLRPKPDGLKLGRALMGMTLRDITPDLARDLRLPTERGLLVVAVETAGPADRIGVRRRDILFHVDGFGTDDLDELGAVLESRKPGQPVQIGILRGRTAALVPMRLARPTASQPGK